MKQHNIQALGEPLIKSPKPIFGEKLGEQILPTTDELLPNFTCFKRNIPAVQRR
jgi:hypothetical protein